MKLIATVAAALLWLALLAGAASAVGPPNIVMILSDDQAWTDYGFMGHPQIQTPHIDRLARESLTFTRGYVPDSLCRPSLATIISGLYPHQHRIVGNDPPPPSELASLPKAKWSRDPRYLAVRNQYVEHIDRKPRLPAILHDRLGYISFQAGKWWEGNYARGGFTHGMTHGDFSRGGRHGDDGLAIGRQTMEPVLTFVDQASAEEQPFLLWYAPMLPHLPHNPPQRLLDKYTAKTDSIHVARYWAACEWFDDTVGQLLAHLDDRGLSDNTIVVYVTDNGWHQPADSEGGGGGGPRAKRSPYEGGVRTPIMIRWPGKVAPRMDAMHLASSIDLVPTLLAAVGERPVEGMTGVNLLDPDAVAARERVYGEIFEHDIQHLTDPRPSLMYRWIVEGDWKLIVPETSRVPDAPVELFQITADPHEADNVAATHPDRVAALRGSLDAWWPTP